MDLLQLTINEHINLLNEIGYKVEKDEYNNLIILYKDKEIGSLSYEDKNMFYLYRDNRFVGNRDLSTITFNKRKEKNIRGMIHIRLNHRGLHINCYNQLISNDRNYIRLSDGENIIITKYVGNDEIQINSLLSTVKNEDILYEMQKPFKEKNRTYSYKRGERK